MTTARKREGSRRARPVRPPLTRARILATALVLAGHDGLASLSTRRLAAALGCEAMSIYHHFASKQHLLDAIVEHAIAGIREPDAQADPIAKLAFLGREYRAMAHRHPQLFHYIALHRLNMPSGVAFIERMLRHFHAAIPDERLAAQAFRVFGYYVVGAGLDETSGYATGPSAAEPVTDDYIARECPHLAAAAPSFKPEHFDATFELGFAMLLDGVSALRERVLARERSTPKPVIRPKA